MVEPQRRFSCQANCSLFLYPEQGFNVIEHNIGAFQPKKPDKRAANGHPNLFDFIKAARDTIEEDALFPVQREPRLFLTIIACHFIKDKNILLPC
jgi:hypothetical protein